MKLTVFILLAALAGFCQNSPAGAYQPRQSVDAENLGPRRPAGGSWKVLAIADWSLTAWDAKVSVSHHIGCVESNPLFGTHPSPGRYWSQMALTTGAVQIAAWQLRRHGHARLANLFVAGDAASHAIGVGTNYSACRVRP